MLLKLLKGVYLLSLSLIEIDFFDEIRKNRDQYENYTVPCYFDEFTRVAIFQYQPDAQLRIRLAPWNVFSATLS